jgi:hypothetical protein
MAAGGWGGEGTHSARARQVPGWTADGWYGSLPPPCFTSPRAPVSETLGAQVGRRTWHGEVPQDPLLMVSLPSIPVQPVKHVRCALLTGETSLSVLFLPNRSHITASGERVVLLLLHLSLLRLLRGSLAAAHAATAAAAAHGALPDRLQLRIVLHARVTQRPRQRASGRKRRYAWRSVRRGRGVGS